MAGVAEFLDRVNEFEIYRIPIGSAAYFKAAEQVANFVIGLIEHVLPVPPVISGGVAAYLMRLPQVEAFLGRYGSYYTAMAAAGTGLDRQFGISTMMNNLLSKVSARLPQIKVSATPTGKAVSGVEETQQISGVENAGNVGELSSNVGELPSGLEDADIYEEYMKQAKIAGIE